MTKSRYHNVLIFGSLAVLVAAGVFAIQVYARTPSKPSITSISPTSTPASTTGVLTVTIRGSSFQRGAVAALSLVPAIRTTYKNSTTLTATFQKSKLTARTYDVLVWNKDGGKTGRRKLLTITYPTTGSVVYAVGDIADCGNTNDSATAALVTGDSAPILTLGDTVYENGSTKDFTDCFTPSWGSLTTRIRPSVGNHEYNTLNATPYFSYFAAAAGQQGKGYYSYDIYGWHFIALNSNCSSIGGCDATSEQYRWLKDDLAAHPTTCTIAYFHHPAFSSGLHGNQDTSLPLWQALYDGGADVVLNGHDHNYERFANLDRQGKTTTKGMREFVVGTGGKSLYPTAIPLPGSQVRNNSTYGVLRLRLNPSWYSWDFLPIAGSSFTDSGTSDCR
jgi:hypothetical protein